LCRIKSHLLDNFTYPSLASGISKRHQLQKDWLFLARTTYFAYDFRAGISFLPGIETGIMKRIITRFLLLLLFGCCFDALLAQNKQIDSLLSVLATAKEDTAKVNTLNNLSRQLEKIGRYAEARKYADDALFLAEKIGFKKGTANALNNIGNIYHEQSNYGEALKNHFAALKIREEIGDKKGIAASYNNIGFIYGDQGNDAEALKKHFDALKIRKEIGDKEGIASSYNHIGNSYLSQGNYPEALKNYQASLTISEEIGDIQQVAFAHINMGNIYARQGDHTEALKNYQAALKISESIGDKKTIATLYYNIAIIYGMQGNYPEAMKSHLASLKIKEELGYKNGIANSYNCIGNIYQAQSNYPEALKNYLAAIKIKEELGDKKGIAMTQHNMGILYDLQGNYLEALKSHHTTLKLSEEIGDKHGIAGSYHEIGVINNKMGNYSEAMKNSQASLTMSKEIGDKETMAASYINIGTVYGNLKKFPEAIQFMNNGLSLSKEIGSKHLTKESYNGLAQLDSAMGNYSLALEHYKLYTDFKDSLLNETNSKQMAQMKEQYESEKKDKEIVQLESDKTKLESEKQIGALLLKTKQDSLGIVEAEKEKIKLENDKVKLENDKMQAFNLYSRQQIELLGNEKKIQQLQIDKDQADYAIQKAESDKKQEQLTVLNKEKDIKDLQLVKQKQAKNYFLAGLVLFFILLFFVYRNYQNQRKVNRLMNVAYAKDKAELELQSLRAQLNPHFMFNSLNAIQELILKEDFDNSHTYLARFAKLLRMLLENAERPFVPLNSEIDFLELYLSLEKLRIPDLQFSIQVDPTINTGVTFLPNMVLQPYIENALWHGLSQKIGKKNLELIIDKQNGAVIYNVKDNGIGRRKAAEFKSLYRKGHKSIGMELLTKRFKLLHEEFGSEIKTQINDVIENGEVGGTLVVIGIPNSISENARTPV